KTYVNLPWKPVYIGWDGRKYDSYRNVAFYTTDGMRYEFDGAKSTGENVFSTLVLHENPNVQACFATADIFEGEVTRPSGDVARYSNCGGCGSYGLMQNPNNTTKPPCAILVDVNGDRKPTPKYVYNSWEEAADGEFQKYWIPTLESRRVSDIFVILITEDRAIPYGVVAQKAMYQAQK
ncbi:MAG: hypothetical protein Q4F80_03615, partial [bacterium]|nr:hypothetical protein [bacterium]